MKCNFILNNRLQGCKQVTSNMHATGGPVSSKLLFLEGAPKRNRRNFARLSLAIELNMLTITLSPAVGYMHKLNTLKAAFILPFLWPWDSTFHFWNFYNPICSCDAVWLLNTGGCWDNWTDRLILIFGLLQALEQNDFVMKINRSSQVISQLRP